MVAEDGEEVAPLPFLGCLEGKGEGVVCSLSDLWLSWHPSEPELGELDLISEPQTRKSQKVWWPPKVFGASECSQKQEKNSPLPAPTRIQAEQVEQVCP